MSEPAMNERFEEQDLADWQRNSDNAGTLLEEPPRGGILAELKDPENRER